MPELPEVETVRRTLQRLVKGKTIETVDINGQISSNVLGNRKSSLEGW